MNSRKNSAAREKNVDEAGAVGDLRLLPWQVEVEDARAVPFPPSARLEKVHGGGASSWTLLSLPVETQRGGSEEGRRKWRRWRGEKN